MTDGTSDTESQRGLSGVFSSRVLGFVLGGFWAVGIGGAYAGGAYAGEEPPAPSPDPADAFIVYKAKPSKVAGNQFPTRGFVLTLNDMAISDESADDPENYQPFRPSSYLNPGMLDDVPGPVRPDLHYVRYQTKEAREGIGEPVAGRFPKAASHRSRRWTLANRFGDIVVDSNKVTAMLVPTASGSEGHPSPLPGGETHYECYSVKVAKDAPSKQVPNGRLVKKLQAFLGDGFGDCASMADGSVSWPGTVVEGKCLFRLTKVVELCNPAASSNVDGGRTTTANITGGVPATTDSLLCYRGKLAKQIAGTRSALLARRPVGTRFTQSAHVARRLASGTQVFAAPSNNFPAPTQIDTVVHAGICVPSVVEAVQ